MTKFLLKVTASLMKLALVTCQVSVGVQLWLEGSNNEIESQPFPSTSLRCLVVLVRLNVITELAYIQIENKEKHRDRTSILQNMKYKYENINTS